MHRTAKDDASEDKSSEGDGNARAHADAADVGSELGFDDSLLREIGRGAGAPPPLPKSIGRFLVRYELGSGAMGTVYCAEDPNLSRDVAIKVVNARLVGKERTLLNERLAREAEAMAMLRHPQVVPIHESGNDNGQFYIVMELVKGPTLREWARAPNVAWSTLINKLIEAGRGLAAAHQLGLVHRDFKPDNVLVGPHTARVTDFGVVLNEGREPGTSKDPEAPASDCPPSRLTRTGATVGTPRYMAPEQHCGVAAESRSDQYSYCLSAFELLYRAWPTGIHHQPRRDSIPVISEPPAGHAAPDDLWDVLWRGLHEDPENRWPSMGALLDAIEHSVSEQNARNIDAQVQKSSNAAPRVRAVWPLFVGSFALLLAATWWLTRTSSSTRSGESGLVDRSPSARDGLIDPTPSDSGTTIWTKPHSALVASLGLPVPGGWREILRDDSDTLTVYARDDHYVARIDLRQGTVRVLAGTVVPTEDSYQNLVSRERPDHFWRLASTGSAGQMAPRLLFGGGFATTTEQPTPIAFGLKIEGKMISLGYASPEGSQPEYPGQVRLLTFNNERGRAWVGEYNLRSFTTSPDALGALDVRVDKRANEALPRSFVGLVDADGDGDLETMALFVSRGATQREAIATLKQFGAPHQAMLAGASATFLVLDGELVVGSADTLVAQATALYAPD